MKTTTAKLVTTAAPTVRTSTLRSSWTFARSKTRGTRSTGCSRPLRPINEKVFGTPDNPQRGDDWIEHIKEQNPEQAPQIEEAPFEVGIPEDMRETNEDRTECTVTSMPTPFGDEFEHTDGAIDILYKEREAIAGFSDDEDEVELDAWFEDPAGNHYEVELQRLQDDPGDGVVAGGFLHGTTDQGSPLFPEMYNYASL